MRTLRRWPPHFGRARGCWAFRVHGDERQGRPLPTQGTSDANKTKGCRPVSRGEPTDGSLFPLTAVVAAFGSSLADAITALTEQLGTKRVQSRRALSPKLLLDLLKQPLWLAGIAANVASFALQVVALRF